MKKIMFNDKYGLTQAVLEGRKTMTRRICPKVIQEGLDAASKPILIVPIEKIPADMSLEEFSNVWGNQCGQLIYTKDECTTVEQTMTPEQIMDVVISHSSYKIGEEVAVAQSYKAIYDKMETTAGNCEANAWWCVLADSSDRSPILLAGYNNKMYVKAEFMPHRIRITNIKVERLQDITDEDCLEEGIHTVTLDLIGGSNKLLYDFSGDTELYSSPREAFAALIDRVSGKGTWDSNPWVWAYEFELIK